MNNFTCGIFLILAIFIFPECVTAQTHQPLSRISVKGNKFINEKGETMIFRGLNTSDPDKLVDDGHWDKAYFEEIKYWGANIVRFPVHPRAWRKRGEADYLEILDRGVKWASELGLYVIIDWHTIGNLRNEMYQNPMYETTRKETYEFWRTMAGHYKDNTTVAFFELFNEPTIIGGKLGTCTWPEWKAMNEEMITIIRAHGCQAIPLVAGFNWAYDLTPVRRAPVEADHIAYVSHPYPMKREKPWEPKWTMDWGFAAQKFPLILTEIGFAGEEERGAHIPVISDESYGEAITEYCNEHGISYVVWVFDPDWSPMMFTDWNYTPTRQGQFFKEVLKRDNASK